LVIGQQVQQLVASEALTTPRLSTTLPKRSLIRIHSWLAYAAANSQRSRHDIGLLLRRRRPVVSGALAAALNKAGFSVLLFDYRDYGSSVPGTHSGR
jgi:hypothetical protein